MGVLGKAAASAHGAADQAANALAPASRWLEDQGETLEVAGTRLVDSTCKYVAWSAAPCALAAALPRLPMMILLVDFNWQGYGAHRGKYVR